jgi:hypothetical protein
MYSSAMNSTIKQRRASISEAIDTVAVRGDQAAKVSERI